MATEQDSHTHDLDKDVNASSSKESLSTDEATQQRRDVETSNAHNEEKAIAKPQTAGPGPPPNGGLAAWTQVVGGWMLFFNTWGLLK